jgi:HEPN domain-containing protein
MDAKHSLVRNWLKKARRDLLSARKLARGKEPYLDTAIYHCQQLAEKCVKGWLVYNDISFEKTHDLRLLVTLAAEVEQKFMRGRTQRNKLCPMLLPIVTREKSWSLQKRSFLKYSKRQVLSMNLFVRCCQQK